MGFPTIVWNHQVSFRARHEWILFSGPSLELDSRWNPMRAALSVQTTRTALPSCAPNHQWHQSVKSSSGFRNVKNQQCTWHMTFSWRCPWSTSVHWWCAILLSDIEIGQGGREVSMVLWLFFAFSLLCLWSGIFWLYQSWAAATRCAYCFVGSGCSLSFQSPTTSRI